MKYRKLSIQEIQNITSSLYHIDKIDIDSLVDGINGFYGEDAQKVILSFGSEYNDCNYDLGIKEIEVFDKDNQKLKLIKELNKELPYDSFEDEYYSWMHSLLFGESYQESENYNFIFNIKTREIENVPKLYLKED